MSELTDAPLREKIARAIAGFRCSDYDDDCIAAISAHSEEVTDLVLAVVQTEMDEKTAVIENQLRLLTYEQEQRREMHREWVRAKHERDALQKQVDELKEALNAQPRG